MLDPKFIKLRGTCDFEDFVRTMNETIGRKVEQQYKFAFNIFDVNADGYICVKDAFEIISMRSGEYCDTDIS